MIITDLSKNPALNKSIKLTDLATFTHGRSECIMMLATGMISGGDIKLTVSHNDVNYYPLNDVNGVQIMLKMNTPLYIKFANVYVKCDLTGITSNNLKIEVQ